MKLARTGYDAFVQWYKNSGIEITETETSLVSDVLRVGGTLDAVGINSGQTFILDWKTSNSVRVEYLLQLAGYSLLWEEATGTEVAGVHLLRVGKEFATFHHHFYPIEALDAARKAFVKRCQLYELMKQCKKVL